MRYVLLCFFLGTIFTVVGCSQPTGTVTGKVYYKGVILKGGNVSFQTEDKKMNRRSEILEDGSYRVDKVPQGDMIITVETASIKPEESKTKFKNLSA